MKEERFDLVILGVPERDRRAGSLSSRLTKERITSRTRGIFGMRDIACSTGRVEIEAPLDRHRGNEIPVRFAIGPPAMIKVGDCQMERQGGEDLAEDRQQRKRVRTALHRYHDAFAGLKDAV